MSRTKQRSCEGPWPSGRSPRDVAVYIVRTLTEAGHVAYLAGGCVRDELLGYQPKDYDVATDAYPETVKKLFPGGRYVGESFGVVRVSIAHHPVEVATFRKDWGYKDGRRPTEIEFTDAENDAQRRDFTINGLFENPLTQDKDQQIIDYVKGQTDLENRLVRAIGDPRQRFAEDYLRMLRAVRFAARLGFEIESETVQAIPPLADHLGHISRERIGQEVRWMLGSQQVAQSQQNDASRAQGPSEAIKLIEQLRLDAPTLDEQHMDSPLKTVCEVTDYVSLDLSKGATQRVANTQIRYPTYLAAWLLDRHFFDPNDMTGITDLPGQKRDPCAASNDTPQVVLALERFTEQHAGTVISRWRRALCLSNDDRNALKCLLNILAQTLKWGTCTLAQRKKLLAQPLWSQALILIQGLRHQPDLIGLIPMILRDVQDLGLQELTPPPWITGDDLIAEGFKTRPKISPITR